MSVNTAFLQATLDKVNTLQSRMIKYEDDLANYTKKLSDHKKLSPKDKRLTSAPCRPNKILISSAEKASFKKIKEYIKYHLNNGNIELGDIILAKKILEREI